MSEQVAGAVEPDGGNEAISNDRAGDYGRGAGGKSNGTSQNHLANSAQENLFTRVVNVDGKSYYLDVRKNRRGIYLKMTESSAKRRSTILLSGKVVGSLNQMLDDIIKGNYESQTANEAGDRWTTIFSRSSVSFQKKIYFDLMENKFGRSLNIAEVSMNRPKATVLVTEHGWFQLKRCLDEIASEFPSFGNSTMEPQLKQIDSRKINVPPKTFFLDVVDDGSHLFLRVAEVRKHRRETVLIPTVAMEAIGKLLQCFQNGDLRNEPEEFESVPVEPSEGETKTLAKYRLVLATEEEEDSNTVFEFELRENKFGQFLKIGEIKAGPARNTSVFVPADGFGPIVSALEELSPED